MKISNEKLWAFLKMSGVFIAGAIATAAAIYGIWEYNKKPDISFVWVEQDENGNLKPIEKPLAIVTMESFEKQKSTFPVRLAFRNEGSKTAKSVRIELTYPSDYQIESTAERSVRYGTNIKTFRHDIGDLVPSRSFVPIKNPDKLFLKSNLFSIPEVVIAKDGIPSYLIFLFNMPDDSNRSLKIGISLYAENLSPIDMTATLNLDWIYPHFYWPPEANITKVDVTQKDIEHIESARTKGKTIDSWRMVYDESNKIKYHKIIHEKIGTIQLIYVNNQLRRAVLDRDNDEFIDYELWDVNFDGKLEEKLFFQPSVRMIDWKVDSKDIEK